MKAGGRYSYDLPTRIPSEHPALHVERCGVELPNDYYSHSNSQLRLSDPSETCMISLSTRRYMHASVIFLGVS